MDRRLKCRPWHWLSVALLAMTPFLFQGCASIVDGKNQSLSLETPGCPGASCELSNDKGKWFVAATPGSVTVNRSFADLLVKCAKDGADPGLQSVPSKTKGMAFGNILFGGVIGAGVDIANGAAYDYPQAVSLPMNCDGRPKAAPVRLDCTVRDLAEVAGGVPGYGGATGVFVSGVTPGGRADQAGLRAGDVLVGFNDQVITNSQVLKDLLINQAPNAPFRLRLVRQGENREVQVAPTQGEAP